MHVQAVLGCSAPGLQLLSRLQGALGAVVAAEGSARLGVQIPPGVKVQVGCAEQVHDAAVCTQPRGSCRSLGMHRMHARKDVSGIGAE